MFQHYRNQFVLACQCIYCSTFLHLAVVKLILEMPNFLEIEMSKFKKIMRESMKSGGNLRASL